jgi:hypothetical protein
MDRFCTLSFLKKDLGIGPYLEHALLFAVCYSSSFINSRIALRAVASSSGVLITTGVSSKLGFIDFTSGSFHQRQFPLVMSRNKVPREFSLVAA